MDKDFEKKVKQKRIRTIAVAVIVLAAIVYLITGTKVEKADYTDSLRSQIETAQSLYEENKDNVGSKKGQYTKAVMAQFETDIKAAKAVLDDETSAYSDKKDAFETLKAQTDQFRDGVNKEDLKTSKKKKPSKAENQDAGQVSEMPDASSESESTVGEKNPAIKEESNTPASKPASDKITVSLTIRCDTLASDLSKLRDKALEAYVPADGVILALNDVKVTKGESVYDVLDRVCRDKNIHLEAVYTPNYGADYIEGINYLYEFDAGEQSGWMYRVNGVFPNYGCSDYILEDGDAIVWAYTCDMGKDLGKVIK